MDNGIIIEPEVRTPFFVLLHQLGQNETELLFLKDRLPKNSLVLSIRGPRDWKTERDDGYGWFDIMGGYLENFSKVDDIETSSNYINSIIEKTMQKYLLLDDPIFIGVSQGGIVSLHLCVEHKIKCKAVVSLLGFYESRLNTNQLSDTPILMVNGSLDSVIPHDWVKISQSHLQTKNKNVTSVFLNSGHQITEEMIDISMLWIHKLIQ
jgi:predicted esterase